MKHVTRFVFVIIFAISAYHLLRDIFQIMGRDSVFTGIFHRPHLWCRPYCDYVTLPLDVVGIIGSFIVLRRKKIGFIGVIVFGITILGILGFLLP